MGLDLNGNKLYSTSIGSKSEVLKSLPDGNNIVYYDFSNKNSYIGSGASVTDLSGNTNTATLFNTPTFNTSNSGNITLNGTNQYLRVANLNNTITSYMTLLIWVKHTGDGALIWLGRSATDANTEFGFSIASNKMNYWDYDNGYGVDHIANTTTLTTNTWNLIGLTKSTTSFTFYLNGSADGTTTAARDCTYSSNDFVIGCDIRDSVVFLPGTISSAMVYTRTLSSSEMKQIYNATKGRFGL